MAVEDKYVNADVVAGKLAKAAHSNGGKLIAMVETFEVAAADDDGSVYRVFKNLPADLIPLKIELFNDAIAAATDYEIGLYETNSGAAKDIDCLLGTTDINAGNLRGSGVDGLGAVALSDAESMLYELAGDTVTTRLSGYDLAVTANTVGTAAGTITIMAWFLQG